MSNIDGLRSQILGKQALSELQAITTNSPQANVHAAREFRPEDLEITVSLEEPSTSRNPFTIGPIKVREPTSSPSYRAKVILATHLPLDQNTTLVSTASSTVEKALESSLDISCDLSPEQTNGIIRT